MQHIIQPPLSARPPLDCISELPKAPPCHIRSHRDWSHPLPHLRQDWATHSHICTWTGLTPCHTALGVGLAPCHIRAGTEPTAATSPPGLGSPLPHLRRDLGSPLPHPHLHPKLETRAGRARLGGWSGLGLPGFLLTCAACQPKETKSFKPTKPQLSLDLAVRPPCTRSCDATDCIACRVLCAIAISVRPASQFAQCAL